jgi:hypothetical protein
VVETPRFVQHRNTNKNHTPEEVTVRARRDGGFRSPMTRAEDNNAKEQNGNDD